MNWSNATLTGQTEEHLVDYNEAKIHFAIRHDLDDLIQAAKNNGFTLSIASSFRGFEHQCRIWNDKFIGIRPIFDDNNRVLDIKTLTPEAIIFAILRWSALPGASRHHWGTDLDIFASNLLPKDTQLTLAPWEYHTGHQHTFYNWLKGHASDYGFYFPYAEDLGGIGAEPWHISHISTAHDAMSHLHRQTIEEAISCANVNGKEAVLTLLDDIYDRYICNLCEV